MFIIDDICSYILLITYLNFQILKSNLRQSEYRLYKKHLISNEIKKYIYHIYKVAKLHN